MTRAESILFPTAQGAATLGTWRRNSRVLGSITLHTGPVYPGVQEKPQWMLTRNCFGYQMTQWKAIGSS